MPQLPPLRFNYLRWYINAKGIARSNPRGIVQIMRKHTVRYTFRWIQLWCVRVLYPMHVICILYFIPTCTKERCPRTRLITSIAKAPRRIAHPRLASPHLFRTGAAAEDVRLARVDYSCVTFITSFCDFEKSAYFFRGEQKKLLGSL